MVCNFAHAAATNVEAADRLLVQDALPYFISKLQILPADMPDTPVEDTPALANMKLNRYIMYSYCSILVLES